MSADPKPFTFDKSPYLNTEEASVYVCCPTAEAFRKWARRHGVTFLHRGRRVLVDRRELDAKLREGLDRASRRHHLRMVAAR